jgi:hypothetical protein
LPRLHQPAGSNSIYFPLFLKAKNTMKKTSFYQARCETPAKYDGKCDKELILMQATIKNEHSNYIIDSRKSTMFKKLI